MRKDEYNINLQIFLFKSFGDLGIESGRGTVSNIQFNSTNNINLYDIDIVGFYGWVCYNYNIINDTKLKSFFNILHNIKQTSISSEDEEKKTVTKFIMNGITRNLGSPHSFVYNIQSRFDLIMIS